MPTTGAGVRVGLDHDGEDGTKANAVGNDAPPCPLPSCCSPSRTQEAACFFPFDVVVITTPSDSCISTLPPPPPMSSRGSRPRAPPPPITPTSPPSFFFAKSKKASKAAASTGADVSPASLMERSLPPGRGGSKVRVLTSRDPFGLRVGSGGGTLAALEAANRFLGEEAEEAETAAAAPAAVATSSSSSSSDNDRGGGGGGGGGKAKRKGSILIVHAGGESSRCPTQMALGKAWTSLPVSALSSSSSASVRSFRRNHSCRHRRSLGDDSDSDGNGNGNGNGNGYGYGYEGEVGREAIVTDPTTILLSELSTLFANLPGGSVVVCAGDVLLGLPPNASIPFAEEEEEEAKEGVAEHTMGVLGLAVPSPLDTARNHGVFVLDGCDDCDDGDDDDDDDDNGDNDDNGINHKETANKRVCIRSVSTFLQKPTIDAMTLTSNPRCAFRSSFHNGELSAWIDTGVVCFLPCAAKSLMTLAKGALKGCTETGLMELAKNEGALGNAAENSLEVMTTLSYGMSEDQKDKSGEKTNDDDADCVNMSIEPDFLKARALKVDLYTHFMMALSSPTLESYLDLHLDDSGGMIDTTIATAIYEALSPHSLHAASIPTGTFVHLGTTRELVDFLTMGVATPDGGDNIGKGFDSPSPSPYSRKSSDELFASGEPIPDGKCSKSFARLELAKRIGMTAWANVRLGDGVKTEAGCVLINASIELDGHRGKGATIDGGGGGGIVGRGSVVEHVRLVVSAPSSIGRDCLVSGLRGSSRRSVIVPDGMCLQMLPLKSDWDVGHGGSRSDGDGDDDGDDDDDDGGERREGRGAGGGGSGIPPEAGREAEVRARAMAKAKARARARAVSSSAGSDSKAVYAAGVVCDDVDGGGGAGDVSGSSNWSEYSSALATDGEDATSGGDGGGGGGGDDDGKGDARPMPKSDEYVDAAAAQVQREAEMRARALERARVREAAAAAAAAARLAAGMPSPMPQEKNLGASDLCSYVSVAATDGDDLAAQVAELDIITDIDESEEVFSPAPFVGKPHVLLYLGVDDPIKKAPCSKIYCQSLEHIFSPRTGLRADDVWDKSLADDERTLWNARIHPVVHPLDIGGGRVAELDLTSLEWIASLLDGAPSIGGSVAESPMARIRDDIGAFRTSVELWRALPRLSLCDIRDAADAAAEFQYRTDLSEWIAADAAAFRGGGAGGGASAGSCLARVAEVLRERRHEPCDLSFVVDAAAAACPEGAANRSLQEALSVLDDVVLESVRTGRYDVAGRTLMVEGGMLSDIASVVGGDVDEATGACNQDSVDVSSQYFSQLSSLRSRSTCSNEEKSGACRVILSLRDSFLHHLMKIGPDHVEGLRLWAERLEESASALTELCVGGAEIDTKAAFDGGRMLRPPTGTWAIATAPARVDLCGGWSDTPPVSYEYGGAVACLAVTVDGRKPLSCRSRVVPLSPSGPSVLLRTEGRSPLDGALTGEPTEIRLQKVSDLADFRDPHAKGALVKCALICLGLVPVDHPALLMQGKAVYTENGANGSHDFDESLQPFVNRFCGCASDGESESGDVALEVISVSLLPLGSGMGTSSILGGCVLASVGRCGGIDLLDHASSTEDGAAKGSGGEDDRLIHAVLALEQLLTTGGGWQDQVGGLVGGLKVGRSSAGAIPLRTTVERVSLSPLARDALNERLTLVFTGQPRLARNILRNVLRRWATRTQDILDTVKGLVEGAVSVADALRIDGKSEGDPLDDLGTILHQYWEYKKAMAGNDSRAEPDAVKEVLEYLYKRGVISGGTLCGAGGGGFLALLASPGRTPADVRAEVEVGLSGGAAAAFTWHKCRVCDEGLAVRLVREENVPVFDRSFDIAWHDIIAVVP